MRRLLLAPLAYLMAVSVFSHDTHAVADKWSEIKSPNFTVWANASDGDTRTLVWQLEQIRNVAKNLWPWMKVDLPKPMVVIALKDETSMNALAPQYWEVKGGVRPGSVWVTAPDQHYIAIRADLRRRDDVMVNPHTSAYFSYANLVFRAGFEGAPPLWLTRGLAGVLSNTLVRQDDVIIGAVIPWHLERLRERWVPLRQLMTVTSLSPEFRTSDGQRDFDARSWAFVHYLMFGDGGVNAPRLNAFVGALSQGQAAATAFGSAIGNIDDYERAFGNYVNRSVYSVVRVKIDMGLERERFPVKPMTPVESAVARASFHVAMRRPVEARALIEEAIKLDPQAPGPNVVEAFILEAGGNVEGAKAAYARAVELGTTNPHALYRAAMLSRRAADTATMERVEANLAKAIEVSPLFAAAHAALAEARADLGKPQSAIVTHMQKAVSLEPSNPWHRLAAARVLRRLNAIEESRKAAESALKLADDDPAARAEAERILGMLKR